MIIGIARQWEIDDNWSVIAPMLQKAIDRTADDLSTGSLWTMCRTGHAYLVFASDEHGIAMASVWQFQPWDKGQVFRCLCLGGSKMREWLHLLIDMIKKMMAEGGAPRMVYSGRDGWDRVLSRNMPTRKLYVTYEVTP